MSQQAVLPVDERPEPPESAASRRVLPWGWIIFVTALTLGLLMAFVVFRFQSLVDTDIDPYWFGQMGENLASGHGFAGYGTLLMRRVPAYPTVIGGIYWLFGDHARLIFVLHAFYFAGTCTLAYAIGRRLFNRRTGIVAGLACAFNPMLLRYLPSLHLETQLTFLITLLLWLMVGFWQRPSWQRGTLIGIVGGLASLTKAVALLYPPLFALGVVLAFWSARRRGNDRPIPWRPVIAIVIALGLTIAPWTARNYRSSGHFVPLTTGTSDAFLRGFIFTETPYLTLSKPPYTDAENASNAYFRALAAKAGTTWQRDDYETDQILNKEAKRRLLHEPGAVARKTALGLFTFWYELTSLKNSLIAFALAAVTWAFALIGWRRTRRERKPAWLLLLPVLYFNISLAFLLALGRYSVPVLPALIILAAYGVDTVLDRRTAARV
jgi:4-amino-4-deoxy-L-arabinose transferase-like glycosyltransferase